MRKSQASAKSVEPPYTPPLSRQMVGTRQLSSRFVRASKLGTPPALPPPSACSAKSPRW
jgi:hypothetical protein